MLPRAVIANESWAQIGLDLRDKQHAWMANTVMQLHITIGKQKLATVQGHAAKFRMERELAALEADAIAEGAMGSLSLAIPEHSYFSVLC